MAANFDRVIINNQERLSLDGMDFVVINLRLGVPEERSYVFAFNGQPVDWHPIERPDLPKDISWFAVYLDLPNLALKLSNQLSVEISGHVLAESELTISSAEISRLDRVRHDISRKHERIANYLESGTIRSGKVYNIDSSRHDPALSMKTDKVSSHPYGGYFAQYLIESSDETFALDLGAGFRFKSNPRVVNLEIFNYPSTDVISFGDRTPFKPDTFDFVYTNAVLEHVDNPFDVANEIARVLKPGGRVYSAIPFLQVEHGYPFHYFNPTRMGHRRLFENNFDILDLKVGGAGHPWHIIMRSLGLLRAGLDPTLRSEFENLTVGEILNGTYRDWVESPFGSCTEETMWRLAGSTVLVGKKKQ